MQTELLSTQHPVALERALALVQVGELVAFPTDTVYGVGTLAFDAAGIERIYAVKERAETKAIPVLVGEPQALARVTARMTPMAQRLAQRFWPGPLTLIVPRHPDLPDNLSQEPTVGVRMPDHPFALALLQRAGPMAVTSANLSGGANSLTAGQVYAQLAGRLPLILDGGTTPGGRPSTVVDCTGPQPKILRLGPISPEEIRAILDG